MKINVSALILLLITVLMFIQSSGIYLYMKSHHEQTLLTQSQKELNHELTRLQGTLEYLFRAGDMAQLEEEISILGAGQNIVRAFVTDENEKIITSTKKIHNGTQLSDQLTDKQMKTFSFSQAKTILNIQSWLNKTNNHFNGLAPIVLGASAGSIKPDRIGFLIIEYYPAGIISITQQHLLETALPLIALSAILVFCLGIILYFLLFRRISNFKKIACQVSDGNYDARINSSGLDDLGRLAKTFDQTVSNIQLKNKQLAEQYHESLLREENLTITLNSIGDAVITTDTEGRVVRMNTIAEQLTGWKETDAMHQALEDVFNIINSKTRKPALNPVEKVIKFKKIVGLANHTALISKDGCEYQIADSAAPIVDTEGILIGIILVFHDVTLQYALQEEISKSQQFLQSIIDNSPSIISVRDLDGNFLLSNKAHADLLGITAKEVTSTSIRKLFGQEVADHYTNSDQAAINQDNLPEYEETFVKEGKTQTLLVSKFRLIRNGNIYGVGTIATNISIQKEQAEQLKRSQKMDALGKLTGGIAHDYNNMIGIVLGYSELLAPHLDNNPKLKSYLNNITLAGKRGAELTKQLLTFTKSKSANLRSAQINTLILNSADMLKKTFTHKITLKLELAPEAWDSFINPGEFGDALVNLSINALHAMPEGGILTIQTTNQTLSVDEAELLNMQAGDYIKVSVKDTGTGIDKETQSKIFDPFFTTKGDLGSGLGLSQVYGFIKSINGTIELNSILSEGSEFHLYFPRHISQKEQISNSEKKPNAHNISRDDKSETILIVDDEPALASLAKEIMESRGYRVYLTDSGKEALSIVSDKEIDLLITDVVMPEINGYELADKITKIKPKTKVLLVSGYTDNKTIKSSTNYPQLQKPYRSAALLKAVEELLKPTNL